MTAKHHLACHCRDEPATANRTMSPSFQQPVSAAHLAALDSGLHSNLTVSGHTPHQPQLGLSPSLLSQVLPFHMILDEEGNILQVWTQNLNPHRLQMNLVIVIIIWWYPSLCPSVHLPSQYVLCIQAGPGLIKIMAIRGLPARGHVGHVIKARHTRSPFPL